MPRAEAPFLFLLCCACMTATAPKPDAGDSAATSSPLHCTPGDTRVCIGPSACHGGQMCDADGAWGECDCGDGTATDTTTDTQPDTTTDTTTDTQPDTTADTTSDTTDTVPVPTTLDLHEATIYDNPSDLADWPVTTTITRVEFGSDVHVEFSKQDGVDRWPDITPPGWDGPLQYTLGLAEYIDGHWYASAAIQYWYGLWASGGNVALDNQIAVNWYYDGRWGELAGRQPATGELVGVFVVAGNVRGVLDGSQSPALERSNVVLVAFPDASGATYSFP